MSIEHNASIIKQFLRITSFLITCYTQCGQHAAEESDCDSESEPISDRPSASQTSSPTPTNAAEQNVNSQCSRCFFVVLMLILTLLLTCHLYCVMPIHSFDRALSEHYLLNSEHNWLI